MNDWEYVNFSEDHEMDYHLGLVSKSKSAYNRKYLIEALLIKSV